MGGVGHGAGADNVQAMAMNAPIEARIAPQLIDAVQRGMNVQELADVLGVPENQAAELMQGMREGVLREGVSTLIAFFCPYKTFCSVMSHPKVMQQVCCIGLQYFAARSSRPKPQILKFLQQLRMYASYNTACIIECCTHYSIYGAYL